MFGQGFNSGFFGGPPCFTDTTDIFKDNSGVALYTLDYDASDSGNATGKFNEGAIFNGSSSYIDLGSTIDDPLRTAGEFGVSLWVNINSYTLNNTIFKLLNNIYVLIFYNSSNQLECRVVNSSDVASIITTPVSLNTWYHVVWTGSSTNGVTLYLNGSSVGNTSWNGTFLTYTNTTYKLNILGYNGGSNGYYDGKIDQVRIYNTALDSTDVSNLYAETVSDTSTLSFPSGKTAIATYQLDGNSTDLSGNYNGTDTNILYRYDGTPTAVDFGVGGKTNYGARFNGSSSKVSIPNVIDFATGEHTISAWVYITDTSTSRFMSNLYTGTVPDGSIDFVWIPSSNSINIDFSIGGSNYTNTITSVNANEWIHIVATFVNDGTCTAYKNGSSIDTVVAPSFTASAYQDLNLGYYSRGNDYWSGKIDQVRIFSKALSSTEVSKLYGNGAGETACVYTCTTDTVDYPTTNLAYYKLDNSSEDYSTGGNDGSDTNVEYRFGRFGQAAVFNNDSAITTSLNIGRTNDFTISFWIKDITDSNYGTYADKWVLGVYNNDYIPIIYNKTSGKIKYFVHDGTTLFGTLETPVLDDNWHHIVFTQDVNIETKLYVDGVLQNSETVSHTSMTQRRAVSGGTGFYFGQNPSNSSTDLRLKGSIDQVRIYSTALTSSQVTQLYNEKPCADTSNFKTVLYEGTGANQYISQVGFDLDVDNGGDGGLVWIKNRDQADNHVLFDTVRGASKYILSSSTSAESPSYPLTLSSFEKNGFFLGTDATTGGAVNGNNESLVAWCWKGGGDAVSNTDGTITSQVSANTEAGFSIVKYTGDSSATMTVGHGLSQSPQIVISKRLDSSQDWGVYTNISTGNNTTNWLSLNDSDAYGSGSFMTLSSTLLSAVATGAFWIQGSQIAYCWHSVAGYSKIGSYTGNGSSTGPIVYTTDDGTSGGSDGFEPKFIMIKRTDNTGNWYIVDSIRSTTNPRNDRLLANTTNSEVSYTPGNIDFLSNAFQLKGTYNSTNALNGTYIYMAFK